MISRSIISFAFINYNGISRPPTKEQSELGEIEAEKKQVRAHNMESKVKEEEQDVGSFTDSFILSANI